ncbi:mitochondrial dicarboxylate carrier-like isoform X2 [Xenia sp. Carnegie-2017]|uniref:mitochondrial dicarboxylate carrier-like isoform X2 n=1 Tax=Xenia sp. Carnegie-2017 TaxID=2897299 RepID=UPI001F0379DE|nr:mitochondrial dicarboxylate carrier-like isoform X2 [Xenia sp. Carnegie-2017]
MANTKKEKVLVKKQRWYLGGIASGMAVCVTHPLDLLKVHLQTQQKVQTGLVGMAIKVVKSDGVLALYNGLSASILRQLTYSTTRFGIYEIGSSHLRKGNEPLPFYQKLMIGAFGGFVGGIAGNPADLVNVRMQNDIKVAPELRRNYNHAMDGVIRIVREEGLGRCWRGVTMTATRGMMITSTQVSCYDQIKETLLNTRYFDDNILTHFASSFLAGTIATAVTQPFDVMKTRMMNSTEYKNLFECFWHTAKLGPMGFYKGFIPAWVRLGPHTIVTWLILEQLRRLFPL